MNQEGTVRLSGRIRDPLEAHGHGFQMRSVRRVLVIALLMSRCMSYISTLSFHFLFCKRDVCYFVQSFSALQCYFLL